MLTLTLLKYLFDSFQEIHLSIDLNLNVPMIKFKYECCAIDQVTGTNNDFDRTPWCTTSGSCQTTASQIPKTCCNYVTEEDYGNAPIACHSSVNPGTFKSVNVNYVSPISAKYRIAVLGGGSYFFGFGHIRYIINFGRDNFCKYCFVN